MRLCLVWVCEVMLRPFCNQHRNIESSPDSSTKLEGTVQEDNHLQLLSLISDLIQVQSLDIDALSKILRAKVEEEIAHSQTQGP